MIRMFTALFMCVAASSVALAGDAAELNILGFTTDGKVFAFEEYGVQDGSGFPYANRFYIDTTSDQFVSGTPIRARIDEDGASTADARRKTAEQGEQIIPSQKLRPGFTAAYNAVTEQSADPFRIVALPRPIFPPIDKAVGLRLEEIDLPGDANCEGFGQAKGFRLIRFDPETNADIATLHEDKRIPASRSCPLGYRLGALYTDMENGVMAVLVSTRGAGFEGPNNRWLAITGSL